MFDLPLNVDYTGKTVVVTGAGGVLCSDMARAFAKAGAKVAALDLNEEAVKSLADEIKTEGFQCEGFKANVLDAEMLEDVHQQIIKVYAIFLLMGLVVIILEQLQIMSIRTRLRKV